MDGKNRKDIYPGLEVDIILKKDQRNGVRTRGIVQALLTSSAFHSEPIYKIFFPCYKYLAKALDSF
jgi:uncharacterized repeat protein (TIGR03833 family)